MEFTLRQATLPDADELGRVHIACWREAYPHLLSEASFQVATPEWRASRWRRVLPEDPGPRNGHVNWLAEVGGTLVGFSSAGPAEETPLQLHALYVLARYHGTGIGQALLERALGDRPAQLWVAEENPRARAFYRRNGFEPTGERKVDSFVLDRIAELRMARV